MAMWGGCCRWGRGGNGGDGYWLGPRGGGSIRVPTAVAPNRLRGRGTTVSRERAHRNESALCSGRPRTVQWGGMGDALRPHAGAAGCGTLHPLSSQTIGSVSTAIAFQRPSRELSTALAKPRVRIGKKLHRAAAHRCCTARAAHRREGTRDPVLRMKSRRKKINSNSVNELSN